MDHDPGFDRPARKWPLLGSSRWARPAAYGLVLLLVYLLLAPVSYCPPEPGRRLQCVNNLKQIALALHAYNQRYGTLPPLWTGDAAGRRLHSWRTLILPFLDDFERTEATFRAIDLARPWDDPAQAAAARAIPNVYRCPSAKLPPGKTSYLARVGPDACFRPDAPRRLAEVGGDQGATLMVIEADTTGVVPWMAPLDADESWLRRFDPDGDVPHSGGREAAFADGSVGFFKSPLSAAAIRARSFVTPAPPRSEGGGPVAATSP